MMDIDTAATRLRPGVAAVFLLCLLVSLTARIAVAQTGSGLSGVVRAKTSGRPVADATVAVDGSSASATTGPAGQFELSGLARGSVTLVVRAQGYVERRVPDVPVGGAGGPLVIELEPTPNFLERVQVTATKDERRQGDVAAQTEVIDRSLMDARGDQRLVQAIEHVPGAVVSTQLGIFESVMLRGMPRGDPEFTNTLLLIDGVPQTLSNNGARVIAMPINDAESIEVVRGPNSALYGRTAIGGAVNLRTGNPTPDHQLTVDLTAGQFTTLKGVARASGPVKDWGGYYLSAGSEHSEGYYRNLTSDDYKVGNTALFGKLTFMPDAKSVGSVSFNRVDSDNNTPTNEPVIDGHYLHNLDPAFERFTSFNIPGTNYHQNEKRLTLNYERNLTPWARVIEVFGYRDVQHKFIEDGDFIAGPFDLDAQTVTQFPFSQQTDENIVYQELRAELTPAFRLKSRLTIGGSYEWNGGTTSSDFIYTDPDLGGWTISYVNPLIPPQSEWQHDTGQRDYHLGVTGLFAQYTIEPATRVIFTAAGRYDRLALDNRRDGGDELAATFDAFSPKLNGTVKLLGLEPDARLTLNAYGAYSQAFLPPRRPSSLVPADVDLNLEPEDIDNYEGGVKGTALENRVAFDAAVFHMRESGVVLSTRQGPFFVPTNAGEQLYKGFEGSLTVSPTPHVSAYVNTAFYRNRFGDFVIQSEEGDEVLNGNRLPISPDHVVNWGISVTPRSDLNLRLDVKHMGAVQANRENTFELQPYSIVDAAATWRVRGIRLTLAATNLFDSDYYWNSDGETADPGQPRQLLLSTSFTFK